jgi:interferon gamma-inducible protein 30
MFWSLVLIVLGLSNAQKVNVSVYFEAMDVASQQDLNYSIRALYENKEVWNVVNLNLVPFGLTVFNPDGTLTCQYGEEDCVLNFYEGCVMYSVDWEQELYMPFILCLESNATESRVVQCMRSANIDETKVEKCMNGTGKMEIANGFQAERSSLLPQPMKFPATYVNGEYIVYEEDDMISLVCTTYQKMTKGKNVPDACRGAPVAVELYFESLCPGCREFIFDTLHPVFYELSDIMRLSLYPYGNARINPRNGAVTCQHGVKECLYNQVEGCAIYWGSYNANNYFDFIYCFEKNPSYDNSTIDVCANPKATGEYNVNIKKCMNGDWNDQKDQIILGFAKATNDLNPRHQYTPWVVVNGAPTYDDIDELKQLVCDAYTGETIAACTNLGLESKKTSNGQLCFA